MLIPSLGVSKMLSVQQTAWTAHECSAFGFRELRVAKGLLSPVLRHKASVKRRSQV